MHRVARVLVPPAAAEDKDRALRLRQEIAKPRHLGLARRGLNRLECRRVGNGDALLQHVGRQADDHRTGAATGRGVEGARNDFGDAGRVVDLGRPFRHAAENRATVDLLERLALTNVAVDLADEQDHRRRILVGDVNAGHRVGGARSPRHEADTRPAGRLAYRFGHHRGAALLAADRHRDVPVVEGIENAEIALAGHAEHVLHPVPDELVDQHLGSGPGLFGSVHASVFLGATARTGEARYRRDRRAAACPDP